MVGKVAGRQAERGIRYSYGQQRTLQCWAASVGGALALGGSVWRGLVLSNQGLKCNFGGLAHPRDRMVSALVDRGHPETAAKLSHAPPCHLSLRVNSVGIAVDSRDCICKHSDTSPPHRAPLNTICLAVALTQLTVSFAKKKKIPQVSEVVLVNHSSGLPHG